MSPRPPRLGTLRANLHVCNLLQAATCSYGGQILPLRPASWDAVLLDPPCSGWGTAEKHPNVLKLWRGDKLKSLTGLQQSLLRSATDLLRPGGRLVYSTCTTNEAENEAQVRFAEEELGLVREYLPPFPGFVWEERGGGEDTLRVDGARSKAQGFYLALLRKAATAATGQEATSEHAGRLPVDAAAGGCGRMQRIASKGKRSRPKLWPDRAAIRRSLRRGGPRFTANMSVSSRLRPPRCCRRILSGRALCWAALLQAA